MTAPTIHEMADREVLQKCHFRNEENLMTHEFQQFERARLYARSDETEESS